MTPFEIKAVAAALVAIVALMWALTFIECWWRRSKRS
jgi:DNA-binding transcriptional regulator of glucitol operon